MSVDPKGRSLDVRSVIKTIAQNILDFKHILSDIKDDKPISECEHWDKIQMYSPDEWNVIMFAIMHFDSFYQDLAKSEDKDKCVQENTHFLAMMYDLTNELISRLNKKEVHHA